MDQIRNYAAAKGWSSSRYIVLVEGTTDEALFTLADRQVREAGFELLNPEITVVAAGRGDRGGTYGVARELITLRSLAALILDERGRPAYRPIGLLDNDGAGRRIIADILRLDRGAVEFRDVLRLSPIMPRTTSTSPSQLERETDDANRAFRGMDWEVEDLLSEGLLGEFEVTNPGAVVRKIERGGRIHRELTRAGKQALHRLVQQEARLADLMGVVEVARSLRSLFGLEDIQPLASE